MKLLIKIWLPIKLWFSWLCGKRKFKVNEEIDFIYKQISNTFTPFHYDWKGKYKSDVIFGKIPFDWQLDAVTCWVKGGDCNSLHRIAQVYFYCLQSGDNIKSFHSLLVTFITKPFIKSHAFVLRDRGDAWYWFDYGIERPLDENLDIAINKLKVDYEIQKGVKILAYALQDINYKVIKVG